MVTATAPAAGAALAVPVVGGAEYELPDEPHAASPNMPKPTTPKAYRRRKRAGCRGALSSGDAPVLGASELLALERPGDQRFWLLEELAELLELRSREMPILVTLDDMQWADSVTMWAVRVLSQRLTSSPVGWVIATR